MIGSVMEKIQNTFSLQNLNDSVIKFDHTWDIYHSARVLIININFLYPIPCLKKQMEIF